MEMQKSAEVFVETVELKSEILDRIVLIDFYLPFGLDQQSDPSLLLFNDGQTLATMEFEKILASLFRERTIRPVLCAGIHCGEDRSSEYGIAASADYEGRGAKAARYEQFILTELLPFIAGRFHLYSFKGKGFAGFSLGALSALDIGWNNPEVFSIVGAFSGAFWWRSKDKHDKEYDQRLHRIMHNQIRNGEYRPALKFFFQCGELDEWEDRNKNGVIDSIDDTIDLMRELIAKGYREGKNISYLQMPDGKHDAASWVRAMPAFLEWGWRNKS